MSEKKMQANQALEATPVGAFCSAFAGLAFQPGVPQFGRQAASHVMNPFVNPNKRGVELPKGYKDLVDVLRLKKCQYCDDAAIATVGWPGDYRWCEACQRDLGEFAKIEVAKYLPADDSSEAVVSQYRIEMQRREKAFMHQKVSERFH